MTPLVLSEMALPQVALGLAAPFEMQLALFLHFLRAGCSMLIVAPYVILAALSPPLMLQLSRAMIPAVSYFWCGKAVTLLALI